ncbi:adhesin [Xenorhabdus mauleonii]|uniref:Adhesin n=2 Tax=Xenorhabdus mauleonii TaxID=351675 RepID=A0A1I3KQK3_9GAMM|nr:adhesin [Xenorhabdus mauleonii]SFI74792.1 Head domain of trimeric autotransporter adhesin [Xenorhabdus mauleonii]
MRKFLFKKTSLVLLINAVLMPYSFAEEEEKTNIVIDIVTPVWKGNVKQLDKDGKEITRENIRDNKSTIVDPWSGYLVPYPEKERVTETTHSALALLNSHIHLYSPYATALNQSSIWSGSQFSFASGNSTIQYYSTHSIAMGKSTIGQESDYSTALNNSRVDKYSIHSFAANNGIVGRDSPYSLAIGAGAKVGVLKDDVDDKKREYTPAKNSIVIGQNASSLKENGIALGEGAAVDYANSVAIGKGSKTDRENSVSFGNSEDETNNKYLTNIADGEKMNDAATYGQLKNNIFFFSHTDSETPALTSSYYVGSPSFKSNESNVVSFGDEILEDGKLGDGKTQLRLINVAEGKNDQDAATVGQLTKVEAKLNGSMTGLKDEVKKAEKNAADSATAAATSATEAKTSATEAKTSATEAKASATEAKTSAIEAKASAAEANTSAAGAKTAAIEAKASEDAAKASAASAKNSETEAKASETAAKASETAAKASETAAKTSETAAKASETAAKTSETAAKASETAAKTSETAAKASETAAKMSETEAKASETAAKASETAASESATTASNLVEEAKNYTNTAEKAAGRAEKTATEIDNKIKAAAEQASKEKVKEVEEKTEQLDQKVEEKTVQIEKKIEDKSEELYKYAKELEANAREFHTSSNKRFSELETEMRQGFNKLDNKINRVGKRANAGIAGVAAMTNIPYSNSDRFSVGVGLGKYHDGSAVAVGAQAKLTENVNFRASTSWNNDEGAVMGAGIAVGW